MYELYLNGIIRSKKREKGKWYIPQGIEGISVMVNQPFNIDDVFYYLDKNGIYVNKDILYIAYRKIDKQDTERLTEMKIPAFKDLFDATEYIATLPKKKEQNIK